MLLLQLRGDQVVVADEQGLEGGQLDVLVGAHVAGGEELAAGHGLGVVGHVEGVQLRLGEVGEVVVGQHVSGAGLQLAAGEGAQGVGHRLGRAVDVRQVEERGDGGDLLGRVARAGPGGWVGHGAVEGLVPHPTRVVRVGEDLERVVRVGRGEVHVVVDELAPGVAEVGQAALVDGLDVVAQRVGLVVDEVADDAGAGVVGQGGRADPVGVVGGGEAQQVRAGRAQGRVGDVVADLGDGAIARRQGGGYCTIFQALQVQAAERGSFPAARPGLLPPPGRPRRRAVPICVHDVLAPRRIGS